MKSNNEKQQCSLQRSKMSAILRNLMTGNSQHRPRLKKGGLFITALCVRKRDTGGLAKAENNRLLGPGSALPLQYLFERGTKVFSKVKESSADV